MWIARASKNTTTTSPTFGPCHMERGPGRELTLMAHPARNRPFQAYNLGPKYLGLERNGGLGGPATEGKPINLTWDDDGGSCPATANHRW